jgi:hypothetical protein
MAMLVLLCRICEFPAADSGVRLDELDSEKLSEWWRRKLDVDADFEIDSGAEAARNNICQFCIWMAR